MYNVKWVLKYYIRSELHVSIDGPLVECNQNAFVVTLYSYPCFCLYFLFKTFQISVHDYLLNLVNYISTHNNYVEI